MKNQRGIVFIFAILFSLGLLVKAQLPANCDQSKLTQCFIEKATGNMQKLIQDIVSGNTTPKEAICSVIRPAAKCLEQIPSCYTKEGQEMFFDEMDKAFTKNPALTQILGRNFRAEDCVQFSSAPPTSSSATRLTHLTTVVLGILSCTLKVLLF